MKIKLTFCFIALFFSKCSIHSIEDYKRERYIESKQKFDEKFTDQFPSLIESDTSLTIARVSPEANNVGFLLYEFAMEDKKIDAIQSKIKTQTVYSATDTCLLVVPSNNIMYIENCSLGKLPIDNFADYQGNNASRIMNLDSTFLIYVLEAKSGNHFNKYTMKPFNKMPGQWENGYSKGIAISKKQKTVVYWSIMW